MKRILPTLFLLALALALSSGPALAQAVAVAAPTSGLRAEFLANISGVEREALALAEKVPAEKYSWRPADGVRSVSEVYMHIAGSQLFFASLLGVPIPAGFDENYEKAYTEKAKVVEWLKQSFVNAKQAASNLSDADLDKTVKVFGRERTQRSLLLTILSHAHEHLGQSIAYARMNHVTPPWTEEAQQRQQQAPPKKQP
jgi:uncharacterized damage-inducible protein DinB